MAQAAGFCLFDTAIGACGLAWGGSKLVGVQLPEADPPATRARMQGRFPDVPEAAPPSWVQAVIVRVQALLAGAHDDLADVPLDMGGLPAFQQQVYAVARAIPPGEVLTYGEVARRIGDPGAARAVGQALGHNPFAPIVPCHRVLAAGGRSGGFSADGGARTKLRMLEIEGARLGDAPGLFD
ncbi:methylated-DNA--[protein]-cysteine S-methyltransferase [Caenimonas sedimenti]|uniref:methylated-DNA--[protein]-cysteine S-methyltransferase n=1 Tax=Caenimonas sedimenti TaxID=2596921 RepID=A0A562ZNI3_9BURK|nr:methylated-DNA--[protein]-cysteine S-methyltransferase [Caenimonas sedimenti]TWO70139.1 methylated-DNA--[protein]-cysteine S-methyltransferase [Caenimonas sedimenti]